MEFKLVFIIKGGISLELRQLETFIQVANLKSFSKAADALYITQPTVTNHIQNLEKELDTLLINRFGKTLTLTEPGNLLYSYAINIINSCEMAKFDLDSYKGKIQGHLHIYSSSVPMKNMIPYIMKEFISKYPDISFTLSEEDSKKIVDTILMGESDFGILGAKYLSNSIDYIDLMEDRLILILPNDQKYTFPNFSSISKNILFEEKILFREKGSGTRELIERTLKENSIDISDLKIVGYVKDTESIKELVALGVGISFISEKELNKNMDLTRYKLCYIDNLHFTRKFYFAFHKNRQLSPLNLAFKDFILDYITNKSTENQSII